MFFLFLLYFWFSVVVRGFHAEFFEGSAEEPQDNYIDEYWLQRLIENVQIPMYLQQMAYKLAENSNPEVDDNEILVLDSMVPEKAKIVFSENIMTPENPEDESLQTATNYLMQVIYYAFRAFGCDQDNIWPSVYNLTQDNIDCLAFNLVQKIYSQSEFTRKYFARAIHFGITSKAPIAHRIHEMAVYQFLLPTNDRVWFNNVKIQLKNSFWNEQELQKTDTYEDASFLCGSIPFTDEIQKKIDYYYTHR